MLVEFSYQHSSRLSSIGNILSICERNWSSQVKNVILAAVINAFWVIWYSKNMIRFENIKIPLKAVLILIVANISLAGNCSSRHVNSSM